MKKYLLSVYIFLFAFSLYSQDLNTIRKKKLIALSGSLSVGGFSYETNRKKSFIKPYGYMINLNINTSIYGINIPLNVILNQQGTNFKSPFSRFGMSPTYKGLTLHLGHRNYNWSEFLISGTTINGIGLELKHKNFRFGGIKGILRPALGLINSNFNIPQFSRSIEAIRIGSSSDFEFFYISLMKGKDDIMSLSNLSKNITNNITAEENKALSVNFKSSIVDNKFFITFDGAISVFTENIRNPNIPQEKIPKFKIITRLYDVKPSTHGAYAFKAVANYNYKNFKLQIITRKISPEFKTFGTNYLISDIITYTVNPFLSIWKNKINLSGSFGIMKNNLDNRLINKTNRKIGSLALNINPTPIFGTSFNYSNYSIYQQVIKDSLANDSILINQINHNVNVTPRLTLISKTQIHNIIISANYQVLDDKNNNSQNNFDNKIISISTNYNLGLIKSGFNFTLGINYLQFKSALLSTNQKGINLGIKKKLFKNRLKIGVTGNYSDLKTNNINNNVFTLLTRINYLIFKKSSINLQFYLLNKKSGINPILESRTQISYRTSF